MHTSLGMEPVVCKDAYQMVDGNGLWWILDSYTALIKCFWGQEFSWDVYPSEQAFHRVQDHLIWTSEKRVMAVLPSFGWAEN